MSDRQGIEIDYCPKCRGVWLDRGELDKLIDRSAGLQQAALQEPRYQEEPRYKDEGRYKRKRGGLLGEIFDFD